MASKARRVVKELFTFFLNEPQCLPTSWRKLASGPKGAATLLGMKRTTLQARMRKLKIRRPI